MKILILLSTVLVISAEKTGVSTTVDSSKTHKSEHTDVEKLSKYRRSLNFGGLDPILSTSGFTSTGNIFSGLQTQQLPAINQNFFDFQPSVQTYTLPTSAFPQTSIPQTINYQSSPSTFSFPSSTISTFPNAFNNFVSNPILQPNLRFSTGSQLTSSQPIFSGVTSPIPNLLSSDFSTSTQINPIQNFVSNDFTAQIQPTQNFFPSSDFSASTIRLNPIQNILPNDFSAVTTQIQPTQNLISNDFGAFTTQIKPIQNFLPSHLNSLLTNIQPLQTFASSEFLPGFSDISSKPPVFQPLGLQKSFPTSTVTL